MSSSGELTTESVGRPWLPMSATDLAHDDDDDDDDEDDDDDDDDFIFSVRVIESIRICLSSGSNYKWISLLKSKILSYVYLLRHPWTLVENQICIKTIF